MVTEAPSETHHDCARQPGGAEVLPRKNPRDGIVATLLTGGFDRPYAFGLAMELSKKNIALDVIGSDEVDSPEMHTTNGLRFMNLLGAQPRQANLLRKLSRVAAYYLRLLRYAATADPRIFHILWNNKFQLFDRTLLMLYYKALGKKLVFTAHNVNAGKRDSCDSWLNRLTLRIQYNLCDHIFLHTEQMKQELSRDFAVPAHKTTVIPFGINNSVSDTALTSAQAKQRLGLRGEEKTILFFGNIGPYKGLEYLVEAFHLVAAHDPFYRLIIAGKPRGSCEPYLQQVQEIIRRNSSGERILQKIEYIPDDDTEIYFKAADLLVLPYKQIFQSGVLFLGYSFGLPILATDVGSLRDDIIEGKTGLVCKPCDAADLARSIEKYFSSELFSNLNLHRQHIREFATARHSWDVVGNKTRAVYQELLG